MKTTNKRAGFFTFAAFATGLLCFILTYIAMLGAHRTFAFCFAVLAVILLVLTGVAARIWVNPQEEPPAPRCGDLSKRANAAFWQEHFDAAICTPVCVRMAEHRYSQNYNGLALIEPGLDRVSHEVWSVSNPDVLLAVFSVYGNTGKRGQLSVVTINGFEENLTLYELCAAVRGVAAEYGQ